MIGLAAAIIVSQEHGSAVHAKMPGSLHRGVPTGGRFSMFFV
jgi:hypothetical protein